VVKDKLIKFLIVGVSAAVVNLLLMAIFVEVFSFRTYLLKNVANISSILISIVFNFVLSRKWTWNNIPKKKGRELAIQFLSFNLANLISIAVRVLFFAVLDKFGVFYILNVCIGIAITATISFMLYDKVVFKGAITQKQSF